MFFDSEWAELYIEKKSILIALSSFSNVLVSGLVSFILLLLLLLFLLLLLLNFVFFDVLLTLHLSIFISVINQLDAKNVCFTISLFHASTCFEHMCSSSGGIMQF